MTENHRSDSEVLLCLAGMGGAIGTSVSAGIALARRGLLDTLGLTTESPLVKSLAPSLLSLKDLSLYGWDLKQDNLFNLTRELQIVGIEALLQAKSDLKALRPSLPPSQNSTNLSLWFKREITRLSTLRPGSQLGILVNLCPTEPQSLQDAAIPEPNWRELSSLSSNTPGITPSRLYFRLAIECGLHFINFTPNHAETPLLRELARERGIIYCGRDGKTGQTFLKTVLAPALRDRNLRIDGWYSTNLLGNEDGLALADEDRCRTKQRSKREALSQILGYVPGASPSCHQVHIHYYPPRGDAKEAWDNIDFTGFLGGTMQMKINWLGRDSLLAAPAVLDLVRLVCLAIGKGRKGVLHETSYFFKDPLVDGPEAVVHSTPAQFDTLLSFLQS